MEDYKNNLCMDCMQERMNNSYMNCSREEFPIAMAYVPWQHWNGIYDNIEEAFCTGTIFPELTKPFTGRRCVK